MKKKCKYPIFIDHDTSKPPCGTIEFIDKITEGILLKKGCILGCGYIPKKINKKGEILDMELLEVSIIDAPKEFND